MVENEQSSEAAQGENHAASCDDPAGSVEEQAAGEQPRLPKSYARGAEQSEPADTAGPLFFFCALLIASSVGLVYEAVVRQPSAYLDPGDGLPRWSATLAGAVGAIIGYLLGTRPIRSRPRDRLPWLLLAASVVATGSAVLLFFGFARAGLFEATVLGVPAVAAALVAATLRTAIQALRRAAVGLGVVQRALKPFQLIAVILLLGVVAAGTTLIGMVRSAVLVGLALAALARWSPALFYFLDRTPIRRAAAVRGTALSLLGAYLTVFVGSELWIPIRDLARYPSEIVYTKTTQRQRFVITSGQWSFSLFVDDKLKLSTIDENRYYESLVHPALAAAPKKQRVLVLGAGEGLAEREILRHPEVQSVTVVVVDEAIAELARRMPWLRRRSADAMHSSKIEVVQREPIVWLGENQKEFDVAIVDLADPLGYLESKNYTRYFYRQLAQHLTPEGVAVVQATSLFRSPQTFASIKRTISAAGLSTLPYRAPIPMLGDWGFILVARKRISRPQNVPAGLTFLDSAMLAQLFMMPADATTDRPAVVSTLHDQPLVDIFDRERHSRR